MSSRYAIVENGLVDNVTLADADFAKEQGWIAAPDEVGPGWSYGGPDFGFAPPTSVAENIDAITMRQARLALLGAGKLATVDAAIAAMPGIEGEAARIEWEYAQEVRRDSPLIAALGPAIGLTESEIDGLFAAGASL